MCADKTKDGSRLREKDEPEFVSKYSLGIRTVVWYIPSVQSGGNVHVGGWKRARSHLITR